MTFLDVLGIVLGIIAISFFVICYGGTLIYLYKSLEKEKRVEEYELRFSRLKI